MGFSVLVGILTGLVCVGGIAVSLKMFFRLSTHPELNPAQKRRYMVLGVATFLGQFAVAGAVIYFLPKLQVRSVPFVMGLLATNFLIPVAIHYFSSKEDPR
jgi:hypothetical protein